MIADARCLEGVSGQGEEFAALKFRPRQILAIKVIADDLRYRRGDYLGDADTAPDRPEAQSVVGGERNLGPFTLVDRTGAFDFREWDGPIDARGSG